MNSCCRLFCSRSRTSVTLFGQPQSDQKALAFEVASIKPNPSRIGIRGHSFPGDRFEARNVPVGELIMVAFGPSLGLRRGTASLATAAPTV